MFTVLLDIATLWLSNNNNDNNIINDYLIKFLHNYFAKIRQDLKNCLVVKFTPKS